MATYLKALRDVPACDGVDLAHVPRDGGRRRNLDLAVEHAEELDELGIGDDEEGAVVASDPNGGLDAETDLRVRRTVCKLVDALALGCDLGLACTDMAREVAC